MPTNANQQHYAQAMMRALELAQRAGELGEVPVAALVIDGDGQIIGEGVNRRHRSGDVLAHAEVEAMRTAAATLQRQAMSQHATAQASTTPVAPWNLAGCTLIVTLEPCPMCAGAIMQSHLDAVVFGAWDAKMGACGSVWDILRDPHIGSQPHVYGGVLEAECAGLLSKFFRGHR